jgi:hypothetical protein
MTTPREQLEQAIDAYVASQMPPPVMPMPGYYLPIDPDPTERIKRIQKALGVPTGGQFGPLTLTAVEKGLGLQTRKIRWGVSIPGKTSDFEKQLGVKVQANREYLLAPPHTTQLDPSAHFADDKANGRYPVYSVKPENGVAGWKVPPSPAFLDRWAGWLADYEADLCGNHEPENDGGKPADFQRWLDQFIDGLRTRLGAGHPVRLGACLMAWTAGRNWKDYLPANLEVLAWDGYGSLPDNDVDRSPAQVFDPCVVVNRQLGLPMVIAETSALASRGKQEQFFADLIPYCQGIDILDTVIAWSSGGQALTDGSLAEYRKAFA